MKVPSFFRAECPALQFKSSKTSTSLKHSLLLNLSFFEQEVDWISSILFIKSNIVKIESVKIGMRDFSTIVLFICYSFLINFNNFILMMKI